MKIFVLNRGSSSVKCCLYDWDRFPKKLVQPVWEKKIESTNIEKEIFSLLSNQKIDCIGHRIVHGGRKFTKSVLINADVKRETRKFAELAPLHNLADLEGIEMFEKRSPKIPQIAVFDTAFHRTLSTAAAVYPGPYHWFEEGIQRFGFHGISFQYCARRAQEMVEKKLKNIIVCHLGSGASLCAVQNGKSIDTTMGFTPLEGLMMSTRSGTVDPGILLYLMRKKGKTVEALSEELEEKSGLLGLSGVSSDMRDVLFQADQGSRRAQLAMDVYIHRLNALIGSMIVSLGGMDALVFTAGVGENVPLIRKRVCESLSFLGVRLSSKKNQRVSTEDCNLSQTGSKAKILLIHTQEEFEIARECFRLFESAKLCDKRI